MEEDLAELNGLFASTGNKANEMSGDGRGADVLERVQLEVSNDIRESDSCSCVSKRVRVFLQLTRAVVTAYVPKTLCDALKAAQAGRHFKQLARIHRNGENTDLLPLGMHFG
ncbi:hypothetical protein BaRGS_00025548 [Batillaria attramentaria]|uniref:Uncharacterized protein n=1 Tax=Batillaria attramentaria TaxID=370345 RepID=A0ABD0K834_9CAEN